MAEEKLQINVDLTKYPELHRKLEQMVKEQDTDKSKFIRQLIRRAYDEQEKGLENPNHGERRKAFTGKVKQVAR